MAHNRKAPMITLGIVSAGLLVVVSLAGCSILPTGSSTPTPTPTSTTSSVSAHALANKKKKEETKKTWTVTSNDLLPSRAKCSTDQFLNRYYTNSGVVLSSTTLTSVTDGLGPSINTTDPTTALNDVMAEHCGNPTELDMSINAMKTLSPDGVNVYDSNPWMAKFEAIVAKKGGLREAFLIHKSGDGSKIFVTAQYQQFAAKFNTLLLRLVNMGISAQNAVTNWHIGGLTSGELPRATLNLGPDALNALVLEDDYKQVGCVDEIGYNMTDRRFETFACYVPPVTPPSPPHTTVTPPPPPVEACLPGYFYAGPVLRCLLSKSNNPADWTYDKTGKPPVPTPTTTAAPPKVVITPTPSPSPTTTVPAPQPSQPPTTEQGCVNPAVDPTYCTTGQ
jgi:hypothetical protein